MQTDCTPEEFRAEVAAATRLLVGVRLLDGSDVLLPPSLVPLFRGLDADGDVVIKGWDDPSSPTGEYRVPLTPCCLGSASCSGDSPDLYCKGCYGDVDWKFGCDAVVVTPVEPAAPDVSQAPTGALNTPTSPDDAPAPPVPAAAASPAPAPAKEKRMSRSKVTPAAEQFAALGLNDPAAWSPAMHLAVKQRWGNLPVDRKVDDLRAELAAVEVEATPDAATVLSLGLAPDQTAAEVEAHRRKRNAKVNAWRARNQIQAALDARALKFAQMRQAKGVKVKATSHDAALPQTEGEFVAAATGILAGARA
jgi:hypothetical protein